MKNKLQFETGTRFGKLTVVAPGELCSKGWLWKCRCDCGKDTSVLASRLNLGHTQSCGCARKRYHYLVPGDRYGKLTVVRFVDRRGTKNRPYYAFKCDCGVEKELCASTVKVGNTKSCGCLVRKCAASMGRLNRRENTPIRSLYTRLKARSTYRRREFSLTFEQFAALVVLPCNYCGKIRPIAPKPRFKGVLLNGLDRVDSTKGYVESNVVPSCKVCNMAKSTMTTSEFNFWLDDIYDYRNKSNTEVSAGRL